MAFNRACRDGQLEVVKYVLTSDELKVRADPTSGDSFSLRFASAGTTKTHFEIVKLLLTGSSSTLDIHVLHDYPLKAACQHGNLQTVIFLLTSPTLTEHADPYAMANDGQYSDSLAFAASHHQQAVVEWLINEYGFMSSPETIQYLERRGDFQILANLKTRDLANSIEKSLNPKDCDPPTKKTKI